MWKSFDEMEETLTLEELFETYQGMLKVEGRLQKTIAQALGAEIVDEETESNDNAFQRVLNKVRGNQGDTSNDIVTSPIQSKGGEQFGVGHGIGYKTIGG